MRTSVALLFVMVMLLSACNTKSGRQEAALLSHQSEITVSGAFALSPLMKVWVREFNKTHPGITFKIIEKGSDLGLRDVLSQKTDIGMISSELPKTLDSLLQVVPVARLGVVPIISQKNPYLNQIVNKGVSREDLIAIFSNQKPKTWGDMFGNPGKDPINVYTRADSSGAAKVIAKYLWLELPEIKGTGIMGEPSLIEKVKNDPLALSYCNFIYAIDSVSKQYSNDVRVLPIDFNQNGVIDWKEKIFESAPQLQRAMWLGKFPCSLIRNLYLVTKGKPKTREVAEFLYWIISDGQNFVADNGYIELHSSEIQFLKNSLNINK
jgi:phosphate transport system substrate-binding protein